MTSADLADARLARAIRAAHGCARRSALVESARDAAALTRALAAGELVRIDRGVYATPATPPDVVAARRAGAVLTCVSAAAWWGLPLVHRPTTTHLALPSSRGARRPGVLPEGAVVHRTSALEPAGRRPRGPAATDSPRAPAASRWPPLVAPAPVALVHLAACLPLADAVAAVDAALRTGLVTTASLVAARPTRGWLPLERVLRAADGRSQSIAESFVRVGLRGVGLHAQPQVLLDGVGHVDLLVGHVVVELDGYAHHSDVSQFAEDRRRDRVARMHGLHVMRFTYREAVHDTRRTVAEIAAAVAAGSGRPSWRRV